MIKIYSTPKFLCVVLTWLALFLFSCTKDHLPNDQKRLGLKFFDSITLAHSEPLFGKFYEKFKITKDGKYWVFADKMREKIFVFTNKGKFVNTIGKSGQGPEGIERIAGYDINSKNEIFIYDSSQRMLKVFSINGELLKSNNFLDQVTFGITPMEMYWYQDKILATIIENSYMFDPSNSKLLAKIDTKGRIDTLFGSFDSFIKQNNSYSFFNKMMIDTVQGTVYTNLVSSPFFQKFDLDTYERTQYLGEKFEKFRLPDREINANVSIQEINKRLENTTHVVSIYLINDYLVQHYQNLTKEWFQTTDYSMKENFLIVYERENYDLISEIDTDYTLGAVHDNKLYFIEDFNPDNYTIGIYELVNETN
ncbi:MAG: 6-bladed beta-propeller [Gracilimonas sp.]|jgi:hypothetical protein|nr:6-bladed beta-propeller [Gracilimonas sp.]